MKFTEKVVLNNVLLTGAQVSDPVLLDQIYGFTVQAYWTGGTAAGNYFIEKSNDKVNWVQEDTVAVAGAGSRFTEKNGAFYKWLRVRFAFTGGTGNMTAVLFAKG